MVSDKQAPRQTVPCNFFQQRLQKAVSGLPVPSPLLQEEESLAGGPAQQDAEHFFSSPIGWPTTTDVKNRLPLYPLSAVSTLLTPRWLSTTWSLKKLHHVVINPPEAVLNVYPRSQK